MLRRISAWFRSLVRKLKQEWWLWLIFIVGELLKHRIFETANRYIDRHSGWVVQILSFLTHSSSGIT